MSHLTRKQRIRTYGSYNTRKKIPNPNPSYFPGCCTPRPARCQGSCNPCMTYEDWKDSLGYSSDDNKQSEYKKYCDAYKKNNKDLILAQKNKLITNTVRVSSSEYAMNKASATSSKNVFMHQLEPKPVPNGTANGTATILQWNQSSDRAFPARSKSPYNTTNNIPSHGNSTKKSLTRHRPGSGAGGHQLGVDIKHNSYHRYLLKKKGLKPLRGKPATTINGGFPNYINGDPVCYSTSATPCSQTGKPIQNNKYKKDSIVAGLQYCCPPGPRFTGISEN